MGGCEAVLDPDGAKDCIRIHIREIHLADRGSGAIDLQVPWLVRTPFDVEHCRDSSTACPFASVLADTLHAPQHVEPLDGEIVEYVDEDPVLGELAILNAIEIDDAHL